MGGTGIYVFGEKIIWRGKVMLSICGLDCCSECNKKNDCGGCVKTDGHPFGGTCVAAECSRREGLKGLKKMKELLIEEFNALGIQSLQVKDLNLLNGFFVNLQFGGVLWEKLVYFMRQIIKTNYIICTID